jgi:hypothetical protein
MGVLSAVLDANAQFVEVAQRYELASPLLTFFQAGHPNNSMHNVRLVRTLVRHANEAARMRMCQDGLPARTAALLVSAQEGAVDALYEPLLDILGDALRLVAPEAGRPLPAAAARALFEPAAVALPALLALAANAAGDASPAARAQAAHCLSAMVSALPAATVAQSLPRGAALAHSLEAALRGGAGGGPPAPSATANELAEAQLRARIAALDILAALCGGEVPLLGADEAASLSSAIAAASKAAESGGGGAEPAPPLRQLRERVARRASEVRKRLGSATRGVAAPRN